MDSKTSLRRGGGVIQFAAPWLFILLPLPWLLRRFLPKYRAERPAVYVPFMGRLRRVTGREASRGSPASKRAVIQWLLLPTAWIALVVAVARPQWLEDPVVIEQPMRDLLVALDLSGSMETKDFSGEAGEAADRLTAAKQVLDEFLSRRDGDRVGLVFFGTAAYVQAPFTADLGVVRELLDEAQVRMLGPRTAMGDAIGTAISLFERSEVEERVLIVLTDGNDTGSMLPPVRAAEVAADNGITIHTVAMGDPEAAGEQALDEETLEQVATTTGGQFFHASDRQELETIYQALDDLNPREVETRSYRPQSEMYHWPLALVVVLSLVLFGLFESLPPRRGGNGFSQ
jgi:Ca-activated chloride channel family protein